MSENPNLPLDQGFWDHVDEAANAADVRRPRLNFGAFTVKPSRYIHWVNKQVVDVTPEKFSTLPVGKKSLELLLTVDIQEVNPQLEWEYDRKILLGDKDWHKIFKPSVIALLGKDSMSKDNYSKTLQSLNGKYVEVDDFPQIDSPEYGTVKILRIFNSREECLAAHKLAFTSDDEVASVPDTALSTPDGWETGAWLTVVVDIEAAFVAGQTVKQIADEYGVPVANIAEVKAQMSG